MHEQMKTIRHISVKIAALLLILSGASGCNSFLNVEVIGKSTIDSFFKDIDGLKLAGEGLHATIYDFYDDYYVRYPEIMGDLLNVNVVNADEGTYLLFNYSMKPDYNASYPYNIWKSGYVICTNANNIIEYAPQHREEDPDLVNKVMGYAYFARALAHFGLCNCYGQPYNFTPDASHKGVIAIDHIPGSGEMLPRNSVKEVYELVISDLEKACSLLRDEYYSDCYHISKYACEALLARVYLYMEDWEKAEEYSKKLIDRFPLSPADEYVNMFRYPVKYPGKETILRMNGYNKTSGMNSQCDPVRSNGQKLLPDPSFSNLFDMDDVRKSLLTYIPEDCESDEVKSKGSYPAICKHVFLKRSSNDMEQCCSPFVFRVSEMYLIHAEALCKGSRHDLNGAADDLKALISRARGVDRNSISLSFSNAEEMCGLIDRERKRELCYEGHRLFDIIRCKKDLQRSSTSNAQSDVKTVKYPDYRFILPIAQMEMQANEQMTQNDGYTPAD